MLNLSKEYNCIFCGHCNTLNNFLVHTKTGYNEKRVECPQCENKYDIELLTTNISSYDWGCWYMYCIKNFKSPHNRFWEKAKIEELREFLSTLPKNVKNGFWDGWYWMKDNALKSSGTEKYVNIMAQIYNKKKPNVFKLEMYIEDGGKNDQE